MFKVNRKIAFRSKYPLLPESLLTSLCWSSSNRAGRPNADRVQLELKRVKVDLALWQDEAFHGEGHLSLTLPVPTVSLSSCLHSGGLLDLGRLGLGTFSKGFFSTLFWSLLHGLSKHCNIIRYLISNYEGMIMTISPKPRTIYDLSSSSSQPALSS